MSTKKSCYYPLTIIGILFFVFGFLTWVNGILIPYFQICLDLTNFQASLVAVIGAPSLPAIAVSADPEHCVATNARTNALTKNDLAMTIHVRPEAGLDNGNRSWQGKTSLLCGYLLKVARLDARPR